MNSALTDTRDHSTPKLGFPGEPDGCVRSIQFHMSMYLAAILGFCALATPSFAALAQAQPPPLNQETQPAPDAAPAGSPRMHPGMPYRRVTRRRIRRRPVQQPGRATRRGTSVRAPRLRQKRNQRPLRNRKRRRPSRLRKSRIQSIEESATRKSATGKLAILQSRPRTKKVVRNGGTVDPVSNSPRA